MQKTLRKALEELNKDNPCLDYIRGMLEVLVEEDAIDKSINMAAMAFSGYSYKAPVEPEKAPENNVPVDEGVMLDAMASARLKDLPPIQLE